MRKLYYLVACICLLCVACSEEGPMGPQGEQGKQGEQGIPGVNGTALLSGNGAPINSLGKNGDFYLDKNNLIIYGPKTDSGWGEAISIKGKDGDDGATGTAGQDGKDGKDGSKILSGTEIPTTGLGDVGDFYFDTQNLTIYGPKTSTGWGNPISLRTPTGLDVTVLLYRNHSFQTMIGDNSYLISRIEMNESAKIYYDSLIKDTQQHYDEEVARINSSSWMSDEGKAYELAWVLDNYEKDMAQYKEYLLLIEDENKRLQQEIEEGYYEYNLESVIPIDTRFQEVYDNGIIFAQIKRSNDPNALWTTSIPFNPMSAWLVTYDHPDFPDDSGYYEEHSIQKDKIKVFGDGYGTEDQVKAFKIDIKIVFIPATTVIEMSAKNINMNNANSISQYLGLQ